MAIADALLPEFDHEMTNTRKMLERIPDGKLGWKPHAKSMPLGRLADHIAQMVGWIPDSMQKDVNDMAGYRPPPEPAKAQEILEKFDRNRDAARKALLATPDQAFWRQWKLTSGDKVLFEMPRIAMYRALIMNHIIHHRAQLGVYLRLNDVAVPGMYGPSADEANLWARA
ncbi:MAG TPA: DinB family protein [Bryobacteraceae bacterium]|nr:DinB family protein [Bryobacteraceae bacterium]